MDTGIINSFLVSIVEKRMELGRLAYNDLHYDELEEELHALEDDFTAKFGSDLEQTFQRIHLEYCPNTEVNSPIAYLPKQYIKPARYENGTSVYEAADNRQGLVIDSQVFTDARLVLLPNPVRLELSTGLDTKKEVVWRLDALTSP
jgi:hypothetical protein